MPVSVWEPCKEADCSDELARLGGRLRLQFGEECSPIGSAALTRCSLWQSRCPSKAAVGPVTLRPQLALGLPFTKLINRVNLYRQCSQPSNIFLHLMRINTRGQRRVPISVGPDPQREMVSNACKEPDFDEQRIRAWPERPDRLGTCARPIPLTQLANCYRETARMKPERAKNAERGLVRAIRDEVCRVSGLKFLEGGLGLRAYRIGSESAQPCAFASDALKSQR